MAKKNVPGVVSAMGALLSIIVSLVKFVKDLGGDVGELFYALAQPANEPKIKKIAEIIVGNVVESVKAVAASVVTPAPKLLRLLPPTQPVANPFRVSDTFLNKKNGRVKVSDWGTNFEQFFSGKEETAPPILSQVSVLEQAASDEEIVADLGGKEAAKVTTASLWEQIALQGHGKSGDLRTDGWANIAYIEDTNGVLCTVFAYWCSDGWYFNANRFPDPDGWGAGSHVVSPRNS